MKINVNRISIKVIEVTPVGAVVMGDTGIEHLHAQRGEPVLKMQVTHGDLHSSNIFCTFPTSVSNLITVLNWNWLKVGTVIMVSSYMIPRDPKLGKKAS